jgi:hypothetical protein
MKIFLIFINYYYRVGVLVNILSTLFHLRLTIIQ